jgi:hypothetical protein
MTDRAAEMKARYLAEAAKACYRCGPPGTKKWWTWYMLWIPTNVAIIRTEADITGELPDFGHLLRVAKGLECKKPNTYIAGYRDNSGYHTIAEDDNLDRLIHRLHAGGWHRVLDGTGPGWRLA